ncbi:ankyrin repeat domain-containing protein [Actinoplanes sichuanensis]|uniref:Ankyrin repeat domain-containing protein n=1 Tax=Actinoplanes sichuanensis TaxID=512349 RepID=A0ABW4A284_9ACTN|nr:ankyrin repeat domain-containing protein [Actinoplanes sichuanensis]BEL12785.1 ankyrin repeat domain-containing protein [Actinoplanes sichuanensis]
MVSATFLDEKDRWIAGEAGIAVFADRLILGARPPIDDETLEAVAARCAGPVPAALAALWRVSFGGRIDYQLDGQISFTELFWPGSDGYHDLWGWIDHEQEAGNVRFLPFGGFEYLDRLYADIETGRVVYWQQGLAPGWELTDGDRAGGLAADVRALFRQLALEDDPWAGGDADAGADLRDAVDELADEHPAVADKLRDLVRSAVLDWRAALAAGTLVESPRLRRLALDRAASAGDTGLLAHLAETGCDLTEPVRGGLAPIDIALVNGRLEAARSLLDRRVPVTNTLRTGAHAVTADLARALLARGALVTADAVGGAIDNPDPEVLRLVAARLPASVEARAHVPRLRMLAAQAAHAADRSGDRLMRDRATVLRELADMITAGAGS